MFLYKLKSSTHNNKIITLFSLLITLTSCQTINTNYNLNKLKYGIDKDYIINNVFMSKPVGKKIIDENKEIYVYYIHLSIFDLFFSTSNFPYIGFYPINRTGKEYWLLIDNNKGLIKSGYAKEWDKIKQ